MENLDFFNAIEKLEPKCPKCKIPLKYGLNTKYVDKFQTHMCCNCNTLLK